MTTASPGRPPLLRRLAAFTTDPRGGNPAGVWIGEALPEAGEMQRIAALVGASETAFAAPRGGNAYDVRYFSPEIEVPFCGHATIATGVVLGETHGEGTYLLTTAAGEVTVEARRDDGRFLATLTSVPTRQRSVDDALLRAALAALHWNQSDLDPGLPPTLAFAGAWHLVLAVRERATLDALDYDFDALKRVMIEAGLTTLQLVWREGPTRFHARNPFPIGGVIEDPATGAAAAALGGYLRDSGLVASPASLVVRQGESMGRPSRIEVEIPVTGGIRVTGTAVALEFEDVAALLAQAARATSSRV